MFLLPQIAKNTFYQIAGKIVGTILGLITVGLMTRYLGQTGFGYYTSVIAFLQFFSVLIDFGLQMSTTQMISKPDADEQKIFSNVFTLRLVSSVLFMGLAVLIAWLTPYPLIIKKGITLASLAFVFISLQTVFTSIFQKHMDMAKTALAEVWGRAALLLITWLAIGGQKGFFYIMAAIVVGSAVNLYFLIGGSARYLKFTFAFDRTTWQKIFDTTWPLAVTVALTLVYFRADTVIMSFSRPQSEVGIYGATYKVLEILIQFPYLFLGLILPLLTKFFVVNRSIFLTTIQKSFDFLTMLVVPMIFATMVLANRVMVFVAGADFYLSGHILRVLIFAVGAIYIGALFGYAIVAGELQKKMVKFYAANALASIVLYLIFIPFYSYWAAAVLTVLTELFMMGSSFYILKKYLRLKLKWQVARKTVLAGLIMALCLWPLANMNLAVLIFIGLVIYFWSLYAMRAVKKETIMEIINYRKLT